MDWKNSELYSETWQLQALEQISRVISGTTDVEQMIQQVIAEIRRIFDADRTWLLYPCDPDAPSWRIPVESVHEAYRSLYAEQAEIPMDTVAAGFFREALAATGAITFQPDNSTEQQALMQEYQFQSQLAIALRPKLDKPWLLGLHQCSRQRTWSRDEQQLLESIAARITDALNILLLLRQLQSDVDRRKQIEQELRASEHLFRVLIETTSDWAWEINEDHVYIYANQKVEELLGYTPQEILGKTPFDLMPLYEQQRTKTAFLDIVSARQPIIKLENINRHKNGHLVVLETNGIPVFDEQGNYRGYRGLDRNITTRKLTEQKLRESATVFDNTKEGVIIADEHGNMIDVNRAFCEITGYSRDEVLGKNPHMLSSGRQDATFYENMWATIHQHGHWQGEIWNRRKDGTVYPEWLNISAIKNTGGETTHYVGVFSDITAIKESQIKLNQLAHYDPLTNLPNRLLFEARLEHALARATRSRTLVAVLCLDLDHFNNINDSLGHLVGDQILQTVAKRFQALLRAEDTVARLGGDEFIFIIEEVKLPQEAALVAEKLLSSFNEPFKVHRQDVFLSSSIGISLYPDDANNVSNLMKHADAALYQAKDEGRNAIHFYTAKLTSLAFERFAMKTDLRLALKRKEFMLHYQPQVSLATGRMTGVEALIRWQHPLMGLVSPARFIPLAEESGLIIPIGEWVLHTACSQARQWHTTGYPLRLSVNLSGFQIIRGHIEETVRAVLRDTGLDPHLLDLEITESFFLRYDTDSTAILSGLKDLGVSLSIDDFGTGYSSLSYLKRLPVDIIKIDQSFVRDIPVDRDDTAITRAIISLARGLELETIAEGVETHQQQDFLRTEGCDCFQGYLFSPPVPAGKITDLFDANPVQR